MSGVRVEAPVDGVPGTARYVAGPGPVVALVGCMHGNEPVGGRVLDRLADAVHGNLVAGTVLAVRANLEAAALNRRHTPDGRDMNRLWDRASLDRLRTHGPRCYEERRVLELAPLLLAADCVFDLHSTSRPAPGFLLYRDDARHADLAARLGVDRLVTGTHENAILPGGLCSNVGLAPGERSPRLGFVFESGQHLDAGNTDRAWDVVVRLLAALGMWGADPPPADTRGEVYEVMDRVVQAHGERFRFVGHAGDPEAPDDRDPRQLVSFESVLADEVLLRRGTEVVRAAAPFTMLMPAPTAEPGDDLFYVCQPRYGGLGAPDRTDERARAEADTVERVLDLLDDDALARGTTWASFDSRTLLDLIADQIARATRLPAGHPHRRITVVGRGDWGGDEGERRAGQRYRRAMREALVQGVPIDRVQLLRGAPLGWLDSLTSASTAERIARRDAPGGDPGVRLFLSAAQPHALSVLVTGDVARALKTHDLRYVRVAFCVETSLVEAHGGDVRTRVVRAGVISGRRELVAAADRLVRGLCAEHAALLRRRDDPDLDAHPDGALRPSADLARMAALRRGLRRLQLSLWAQELTVEPGTRVDDRARWLVDTMAATGIRDPGALSAMLVPDAGGLRVEPDRLHEALDRPDAFAPSPETMAPAPPHPLTAADVDADNLERWVGWKRFLKRAQVIPDTRGADVELALTSDAIQRHVARTYQHALDAADGAPGRVLVVVAGEGHDPSRLADAPQDNLRLHRRILAHPGIRVLRIQNARGTHLSWLKDAAGLAGARPPGSAPVAMLWELEHGALVNVVLVATRPDDPPDRWTLDGWRLVAGGYVITDVGVAARGRALGLFTEPVPGTRAGLNHDLLHFCREHCEGLLAAAPEPVRLGSDAWREGLFDLLAAGVATARRGGTPTLSDPVVAAALLAAAATREPPRAVAARLWDATTPWPGGA